MLYMAMYMYRFPVGHRVGVGFPEGRVLLPFYADLAGRPTFTVLRCIRAANFYRVYHITKFCSRRAVARLHTKCAPATMLDVACDGRPRRSSIVHIHGAASPSLPWRNG